MSVSTSADQATAIIAAACAAPSLHNSQPWQFTVQGDDLLLYAVPDRSLPVSDPDARGMYVSCGAAIFNARAAARAQGRDLTVRVLPHPEYPLDVLAVMTAASGGPATAADLALYDALWRRHTDRKPYSEVRVPGWLAGYLVSSAGAELASLRMLDAADTATVLQLSAQAGRELAASAAHQHEIARWIGTSGQDGIPAEALPFRSRTKPSPVRDIDFLGVGVDAEYMTYERHPQLAVLTTEGDEPADWLRAGQALEHVLLTATRYNLSASFLYQVIELDDMRQAEPRCWPWQEHVQMVLRLGYGTSPVPTARRNYESVSQPGAGLRLG